MKLVKVIQAAAGNLLDTFMPGDCPGCGEPVENGLYRRFCEWCARGIEWIRRPFCERCGSPLPGTVSGDCPHCRELQPSFNSGRALFLLTGTGRNFVHGVKYHGDRSLLVDLPSLMEQSPISRASLTRKMTMKSRSARSWNSSSSRSQQLPSRKPRALR